MENLLFKISTFFAEIPNKILRFKWILLLAIVFSSILMGIGAVTRTELSTAQNSFLDADDPSILALDRFRRQFGSDDSVLLVYRPKDGNIFSHASLSTVKALTHDLENWESLKRVNYINEEGKPRDLTNLNRIRRVRSVTNIRLQSATGDTLRAERLVPVKIPSNPAELEKIKALALSQADYTYVFYSDDVQYGAILVKTDFGTIPKDDFSLAIDEEQVGLDESFAVAVNNELGGLDFDESAAIEHIEYNKPESKDYSEFFNNLKAVYSKYNQELEFYPVGYAPIATFVQEVVEQSFKLNIGMLLIITFLLWCLFRSFSAVLWPIVTILLSIIWVLGLFAWTNTTISSMVTLTVMLILAVGIADCVHVMSAYMSFRREGLKHHQALSMAYEKTGLALLVTSLTTIAGIAALGFSEIVPIRVFSMMSIVGVVMAFLFTVFLLPILLDILHPGKPREYKGWTDIFIKFWQQKIPVVAKLAIAIVYIAVILGLLGLAIGGFIAVISVLTYIVTHWQTQILNSVLKMSTRQPLKLLIIFAVVFGGCIYGATQVRIDSNIAELTREGSEVRVAYNVVDTHMAGTQNMEIMIDSKVSDGVVHPKILARINKLQTIIENQYPQEVGKTYSLVNVVKDTNQILHEDNPEYHRIPNTQKMIAQQLYLFNSANPEDRRSIVSDDYSQTHITIYVHNAGSEQFQKFYDEISAHIHTVFDDVKPDFPEMDITVTGSIPLYMRTQGAIANTQYSSFALALGIISVIMILTLGSLQAGLLSIVPNLLPALFTFGLMGLLGISLDTDTLLVAPVIIGIAVDDTIHFMTHYRLALANSKNMAVALKSTIMEVGQAVMITTMVLGLGFAILSFSDYLGTAKMGFFGSLAIFVALLCDLFLLPALIVIFKPTFGYKETQPMTRVEIVKELETLAWQQLEDDDTDEDFEDGEYDDDDNDPYNPYRVLS